MDENAVNDALDGVVARPEEEGFEPAAAEEKAPVAQAQPEQEQKGEARQSPETNAQFAKMRRENEKLAAELSESREAARLAKAWDSELAQARAEADGLRGILAEQRFERDLAEIRAAFPGVKAARIEELGGEFLRLRAAGVANLAAYAAAASAARAGQKPELGAADGQGAGEKDFYSPEEVDRLSKKELDDPRVFSRVMKSMTKWK